MNRLPKKLGTWTLHRLQDRDMWNKGRGQTTTRKRLRCRWLDGRSRSRVLLVAGGGVAACWAGRLQRLECCCSRKVDGCASTGRWPGHGAKTLVREGGTTAACKMDYRSTFAAWARLQGLVCSWMICSVARITAGHSQGRTSLEDGTGCMQQLNRRVGSCLFWKGVLESIVDCWFGHRCCVGQGGRA